ncbi:MAG TPA: DUF6049 family protein [Streptosporangiaceae bacterium]|nr:DUF6049 family protein [Streptosporangiaceae bacterium]
MTFFAALRRGRATHLAVACGVLALAAGAPAAAAGSAADAAAQAAPAHAAGTQAAGTQAAVTQAAGIRDTRTQGARTQQVTIAIASISPQIARPGQQVTVTGTVSNGTQGAVSGLTVQLRSSSSTLNSRGDLANYAAGNLASAVDAPVAGTQVPLTGTLLPGATQHWTVSVRTATLGLTGFGVYPLAAEVDSGGVALNTEHTFLPFWPGSPAAAGLARRVKIAWIWPLIGPPEQAACPALLTNNLATDLASSGRLGRLVAAGSTPAASSADLTWAIDPSLLSSAALMEHPYQVGGTAGCSGAVRQRASPAARAWLTQLRSVTAAQDFFVTPYADVDTSALTHAGMGTDLQRAYLKGDRVAHTWLGGVQRPARQPGGGVAWPAGGVADYGVLGSLAADGIGTVVLKSTLMPPAAPAQYTPSAVTSTPDGVNAGLHVALSDNTLTQILSGAPTAMASRSAGASAAAGSFATKQRFLAETAMIADEAPALPRSVVIAPPREWNPAPGLATALLSETDNAPWLQPTSLAKLVTAHSPAGQVPRQQPPPQKVARGELRASLLRKVRALEGSIQLWASVLGKPDSSYLAGAVAAIESSAWRGNPAQVKSLLARVSGYLAAQQQQVGIINAGGLDTLTGKSGPVPVSINNKLGQQITVRLQVQAPANRMIVVPIKSSITIGPHQQRTVAVHVRSLVAGSTVLKLSLVAPNGAVLPRRPAQLTVDATHFGTAALVIIAIALGVFVVTSAARAIRRGSRGAGGQSAQPPGPDDDAVQDANGADPTGSPYGTDTVVSERARDDDTPEEPDEYASAPGRVDRP